MGKRHLAVALAEAAIQAGQAGYITTAHGLVTDLGRAYREWLAGISRHCR